jgi:prepilin signal peptidase PulO-like enzyme (type II secretory pathway)
MTGIIAIPVLCGLIVGLLANYLADVLPRSRRFTRPVCLACGEHRTVRDFLTGRKCTTCGKVNAFRYWLVLVVSVILSILVWLFPPGILPFWGSMILLTVFTVIIITDMEYRVILTQMSITAFIVTAAAGWVQNGWLKTLLGGVSGFLLFLGLYYLGRLFSKFMSRNREEPIDEEALGFGDVYMAGAIGFLTGFPYILPALLMSIVLGGLISAFVLIISLVKKSYQAFQAIPYGPFIIIGGTFIVYYYMIFPVK